MNISSGGQGLHAVFVVKEKTGGYDILDKLTDVVAPTPTIANAALVIDIIESSKLTYQDDGTVKIALDQYDVSEEFFAALDAIAVPATGGSTIKEVPLENGVKIFGATSSGKKVVVISLLQPDALEDPTKIFQVSAFGGITASSGSFDTKDGEGIKPSYEFNGAKTTNDLVIPAACYPSVVTGVSTTIAKNTCFKRGYFAKA